MGEGNQSGRLLLRGCEMRQLGRERGENGFEERELELGDAHGENPSFPIPSPSFSDCLAEFLFFSSFHFLSEGDADARKTKEFWG